jgi:hypothetical protein
MNKFKLKKIEKVLGINKKTVKRYYIIIIKFQEGKFRLSTLYDEILKKRLKFDKDKVYSSIDEIYNEFNIKRNEISISLCISEPW